MKGNIPQNHKTADMQDITIITGNIAKAKMIAELLCESPRNPNTNLLPSFVACCKTETPLAKYENRSVIKGTLSNKSANTI
jgi:hypothetical protein